MTLRLITVLCALALAAGAQTRVHPSQIRSWLQVRAAPGAGTYIDMGQIAGRGVVAAGNELRLYYARGVLRWTFAAEFSGKATLVTPRNVDGIATPNVMVTPAGTWDAQIQAQQADRFTPPGVSVAHSGDGFAAGYHTTYTAPEVSVEIAAGRVGAPVIHQ